MVVTLDAGLKENNNTPKPNQSPLNSRLFSDFDYNSIELTAPLSQLMTEEQKMNKNESQIPVPDDHGDVRRTPMGRTFKGLTTLIAPCNSKTRAMGFII